MGKAYSLDLRGRIWAFIERGGSRRAAGRHYAVSASTAVRIAELHAAQGTLVPRRQGRPPGQGKLAPHVGFLPEIVAAVPDITLCELASALEAERGVTVHPSSISRVLTKAEMTCEESRSTPPSASARTCARHAVSG